MSGPRRCAALFPITLARPGFFSKVGPKEEALFQLEELGWSAFFEEQIDPEERELYSPARVAEETKKFYRVYAECGELLSEVSGKLLHQAASRQALRRAGPPFTGRCAARANSRVRWRERRRSSRYLPRMWIRSFWSLRLTATSACGASSAISPWSGRAAPGL